MIKRILLLWPYMEHRIAPNQVLAYKPTTVRFPLGIGYLAAYLEPDYEVEILDLIAERPLPVVSDEKIRWGLSDEEVRERIQASGAQMVGISQMFSYLDPIVRNIFRIVKQVNPRIVTVWGGTHPTVMPKECIQCPDVDYIVLGEGEVPLKELLERINNGTSVAGMRSLGYRNGNGEPVINNERSWVEDLNSHVRPARHKVDLRRYLGKEKIVNMVTSRGCPFDCTFCTAPTFYQKTFRSRSPEAAVDEMKFLIDEYGVETILIQDENFTLDMKRVEKMMDIMIARNIKVNWYADVGVTVAKLNENLIRKMRQTGCTHLRLAIESGDANTLMKMRKPMLLRHPVQVVNWAREIGMKVIAFLLLGLPGESMQSMENTVSFALELGCDWNMISMVLPLPGTKIYEDLKEKGFSVAFDELERYTRPVNGVSDIPAGELIALRERANNLLNFENNYDLTKGNVAVAIKMFSDLAGRYPEIEKMWFYLGLAQYKAGKIYDALRSFLHARELNRDFKNVEMWTDVLRKHITHELSTPYLSEAEEKELCYGYGRQPTEEVELESLFADATPAM